MYMFIDKMFSKESEWVSIDKRFIFSRVQLTFVYEYINIVETHHVGFG